MCPFLLHDDLPWSLTELPPGYGGTMPVSSQGSESTYVGACATLIELGQGRMTQDHSDEARLVRNFAHVSLWVGTGHPMFKEPVRSTWAAVSL